MKICNELEARAREADRQAERALTAGMADSWREIATGYRELAAEMERARRKSALLFATSNGRDVA